jgi:GNAT superfamily N-acetyltransferase
MTPAIRTARLSDANDISALTGQLGYDVAPAVVAARLTKLLARADQRIFVADVDAQVAGWLHAAIAENIETDPYVSIAGLVVDGRYRRLGIGRELLSHAERWAIERECSVVRLRSSAARTAAHRFYERLGYTNIKTQYSFAKSVGPTPVDVRGFAPKIAES